MLMAKREENWLEYQLHTGKRLGDCTKPELLAEAKWCFEQAAKEFEQAGISPDIAEALVQLGQLADRAPVRKQARRAKKGTTCRGNPRKCLQEGLAHEQI
jgi:hypothetical protein